MGQFGDAMSRGSQYGRGNSPGHAATREKVGDFRAAGCVFLHAGRTYCVLKRFSNASQVVDVETGERLLLDARLPASEVPAKK